MAAPIGRLFVAVDADTVPAIRKLQMLDNQAIKTAQTLRRLGGAGALGGSNVHVLALANGLKQTNTEATKAAASVRRVGAAAGSARSPMAALTASTHRFSQAFINLRYGNPIGMIAGISGGVISLGKALPAAAGGAAALGAGLGVAAVAAGALAAAGIAATVGAIGVSGLSAAADIEMLEIQFKGLLGSTKAAAAEMKFLQQIAQESIIPTEELMVADRQLIAFGITAQGLRHELVQFLSDYGSAAGLSASQIQGLSYVMGQINAQGKAYTQDIKQLANAQIGVDKLSKALGMSQKDFMALVKDGKAGADLMLDAIKKIGQDKSIQKAAKEARNSSRGIIANLKDMVQIGLGNAFQGALDQLKPVLNFLQDMIKSLDFSKIGKAFESGFRAIGDAFKGMNANAKETADWFNTTIPAAIQRTVETIGLVIRVVRTVVEAFHWMGQNIAQIWFKATEVTAAAFASVYEMAGAWDSMLNPLKGWADDGAAEMRRMEAEAIASGKGAVAGVAAAEKNLAAIWSTPVYKQLYYSVHSTDTQGRYVGSVGPFNDPGSNTTETPDIPDFTFPGNGDSKGGAAKEDPRLARLKKFFEGLKGLIGQIKDARASVREMLDKPFGTASKVQEALGFDPQTFQADTDAIISTFKDGADAMRKYFDAVGGGEDRIFGKKAWNKAQKQSEQRVGEMKKQTAELVRLAKENERLAAEMASWQESETARLESELAKLEKVYNGYLQADGRWAKGRLEIAQQILNDATTAYDEAAGKLAELISARDDFLSQIRNSARSYVNSMETTTTMVTEFRRLDDVGSFIITEKEKTSSIKESMAERLKVLKEWAENINALRTAGLDQNLLQDLISQGPESNGLMSELVSGGQAAVDEVNNIQQEMNTVISGIQGAANDMFFQSGITAQSGLVAQLEAQKIVAQASYEATQAEYERSRMALEEQQKMVQDGVDAHSLVLKAQMEENATLAATTAQAMTASLQWLLNRKENANSMFSLGERTVQGIIDGLESKKKDAIDKAEQIANAISRAIRRALDINSPSRLMIQYGQWVSEGLAIGMEQAMPSVQGASIAVASAVIPAHVPAGSSSGPVDVRVFIGDTELRDIVDVQVGAADTRNGSYVTTGRRL
jgi:tape measure domain-containing protein